MEAKLRLDWEFDSSNNLWMTSVPISAHGDRLRLGGRYTIRIQPRPSYCDRGDWMMHVDGAGDSRLDFADGLPRYFFGSAYEAKAQMEIWVSRREECKVGREESREERVSDRAIALLKAEADLMEADIDWSKVPASGLMLGDILDAAHAEVHRISDHVRYSDEVRS